MMEEKDIRARVRAAIAQALEVDLARLPANADADSLTDWDSLGHFEIIESVSQTMDMEFDHAEAVNLLSEDAIVAAILARSAGQA